MRYSKAYFFDSIKSNDKICFLRPQVNKNKEFSENHLETPISEG